MGGVHAPFVVVTDLDGTLLDRETYSFEAARPALEKLAALGVPVVLSSSKTAAEQFELRRSLGAEGPFIVENGSAVFAPEGCFLPGPWQGEAEPQPGYWLRRFGGDRRAILELIRRLRRERDLPFESFADWPPEELARRTGLEPDEARHANDRCCSEPLEWRGTDGELDWFRQRLEAQGLRLVKGGRFWAVMGRCDKRDGLLWLRDRYAETWGRAVRTVAFGDSHNDRGMLAAADIAVVVRSPDSDSIQLPGHPRVVRTDLPGPAGWRHAVDALLPEIAGGKEV